MSPRWPSLVMLAAAAAFLACDAAHDDDSDLGRSVAKPVSEWPTHGLDAGSAAPAPNDSASSDAGAPTAPIGAGEFADVDAGTGGSGLFADAGAAAEACPDADVDAGDASCPAPTRESGEPDAGTP